MTYFCIFNILELMDKSSPIGVFDSGIGGLSVLKQFIRLLPSEQYIYLGDTARVPYGNKSNETVNRYAKDCTEFLLKKDVKLIIVACNTVSAVALETIKSIAGNIPVIGMIAPAVNGALRTTVNGKIGVIGTRATINSNTYEKSIKTVNQSDFEVFSQECPLFVPFVEEGLINHPATKLIAEDYLKKLKDYGIDTLILGCTHYPLLNKLIMEILPNVNLIDTGEHAAINAIRLLAENNMLGEEMNNMLSNHKIEFYVTDVPTLFFEIAKKFLGFSVESPTLIKM